MRGREERGRVGAEEDGGPEDYGDADRMDGDVDGVVVVGAILTHISRGGETTRGRVRYEAKLLF